MSLFNIFALAGGLGLFLYGMDMMGKGLESAAGSKLKGVLEKVEYTKLHRSGRNGPFDNFELLLYPKLPPSGLGE